MSTLLQKIKKVYQINVICDNCGKRCEVNIKKGISVTEAVSDKILRCDYCYCVIQPKEYSTEFLK